MLNPLKWLIHRRLAKFERQYDYDITYAHEMLDVSRAAFMRFTRGVEMSAHNEDVPTAALFAAKLVATLGEDCGPCTQLVAKMAQMSGVTPAVVRAIVEGDEAKMGDEARIGWRFARAVLAHHIEADSLREQIVARWGRKAVVSLALAIAGTRMYPTIKYAMGHGKSCQRVRVDGVDLLPYTAHIRPHGVAAA